MRECVACFSFDLQRSTLVDAEPVLFIRDDKAQFPVFNILTDERVRTENNITLVFLQFLQCDLPFFRTCIPGQKAASDPQGFKCFFGVFIMLNCQDFSRSHHTGLKTGFPCKKSSAEGHCRFTASYIPLDKPAHCRRSDKIVSDIVQDFLLRSGWLKRKRIPVC